MNPPCQRLDYLVLAQYPRLGSRARAQQLIKAGGVSIDGTVCTKPGSTWASDSVVTIDWTRCPELQYVSRAGYKLAHALDTFNIDVAGRICLDVGISTGGFTDCLLARGAALVYGVDVGTAQVHESLRRDPRVVLYEQTDIRNITTLAAHETLMLSLSKHADTVIQPDFFTIDVSFISTTLILPTVLKLVAPGAQGIILIKPHFELTPADIPASGVVTDPALHQRARERVINAAQALGCQVQGMTESPIAGGSGNHEWLLWIARR